MQLLRKFLIPKQHNISPYYSNADLATDDSSNEQLIQYKGKIK